MKKFGVRKPIVLLLAIGLIAVLGAGAAAWWSAQQTVDGNVIGSGHMGIDMPITAPLAVSGLMPGQNGMQEYIIQNPATNPAVDIGFTVDNVAGAGTLKDNVKVAFMLCTGPNSAFWLKSDGTAAEWTDGQELGTAWVPFADFLTAYDAVAFNTALLNLAEHSADYTNLGAGAERHVKVFYILPENCAADCHDSTATFDMTFELIQHHG